MSLNLDLFHFDLQGFWMLQFSRESSALEYLRNDPHPYCYEPLFSRLYIDIHVPLYITIPQFPFVNICVGLR